MKDRSQCIATAPPASPASPSGVGARALLNTRIKNRRGEFLGRVAELVVDLDGGGIAFVVLEYVDFMGIQKLFSIPWATLGFDPADGWLVLDTDVETLERSPGLRVAADAEPLCSPHRLERFSREEF